MKRYRKLADGEPAAAPDGLVRIACCDCALVHVFKITRRRRGFTVRAWRDPRATAAKRRAKALAR